MRWLTAAALLALLSACAVPPPGASPIPTDFSFLPGWRTDTLSAAMPALRRSCERFAKLSPEASLDAPDGAPALARGATAGAWEKVCAAATDVPAGDDAAARAFLERHLEPHALATGEGGRALFTGYYEPEIRGARRRTAAAQTPIHRRPPDLVFGSDPRGPRIGRRIRGGRLLPYPDRAAIVTGALKGRGLELAWLEDPIDAFFLQIQGSGRVLLADGSVMRVGYAGANGRPYVAIGKVLMDSGEMQREEISMQSIRAWLVAHPQQAAALMNANPSYVFFREVPDVPLDQGATGALGVSLTAGRSLAVDRRFIPLGAPVYLAATDPLDGSAWQHLMVAQDTGGAITGPVRGDIFFGWGAEAEARAGQMKSSGAAWVLLPRAEFSAR